MKFEQYNIKRPNMEQNKENKENLLEKKADWIKERWGISFSGRGKDKNPISLEECLNQVENVNLENPKRQINNLQIDLRHRPDMENTVNLLKEFKTKFREVKLSFHGNSPFIDIEKMSIINADKLFKEAEVAAELGADIFTIHPPGLEQETITNILENNENQNRFLKTYCSFLAEMINRAKNKNKNFKVAVENLPVKNKEGKDISIGVMKSIIETTEKLLESQYGMSKEEAEQAVGITLDISNASAIKGEKNREEVLKEWFSKMKSKIFCFHFYAPQEASPEFERKVNQFEVLYKEYELNVPIYLESKQPPSVTRELYKTITTTKD